MVEEHGCDGGDGEEYEKREGGDLRYVQRVEHRAEDDGPGVAEDHRQQTPVQHVPWYFLLGDADRLQTDGGLPPLYVRRLDQAHIGKGLKRGPPFEGAAHVSGKL